MDIGLQYWSEGGSAPGSFTTWSVVTSWPREEFDVVESGRAPLTRSNWHYDDKYLAVTIGFGPEVLADATARAALMTLLEGDYFRVNDDRHTSLGGANTVDFVKSSPPKITRNRKTMQAEFATLELITEDVQ